MLKAKYSEKILKEKYKELSHDRFTWFILYILKDLNRIDSLELLSVLKKIGYFDEVLKRVFTADKIIKREFDDLSRTLHIEKTKQIKIDKTFENIPTKFGEFLKDIDSYPLDIAAWRIIHFLKNKNYVITVSVMKYLNYNDKLICIIVNSSTGDKRISKEFDKIGIRINKQQKRNEVKK